MSEENDEPIVIEGRQRGGYCVVFDPLDGSSNIDCAVRWGRGVAVNMGGWGRVGGSKMNIRASEGRTLDHTDLQYRCSSRVITGASGRHPPYPLLDPTLFCSVLISPQLYPALFL